MEISPIVRLVTFVHTCAFDWHNFICDNILKTFKCIITQKYNIAGYATINNKRMFCEYKIGPNGHQFYECPKNVSGPNLCVSLIFGTRNSDNIFSIYRSFKKHD